MNDEDMKVFTDIMKLESIAAYDALLKQHIKGKIDLIVYNLVEIKNNLVDIKSDKLNLTAIFRMRKLPFAKDRLHVIIRIDLDKTNNRAILMSNLFIVNHAIDYIIMGKDAYREKVLRVLRHDSLDGKDEILKREIFSTHSIVSPESFTSWLKDSLDFEMYLGLSMSEEYSAVSQSLNINAEKSLYNSARKMRSIHGRKIMCASCKSEISNPQIIYKGEDTDIDQFKSWGPELHGPIVFKNNPRPPGEPQYIVSVNWINSHSHILICDRCEQLRATKAVSRRAKRYQEGLKNYEDRNEL